MTPRTARAAPQRGVVVEPRARDVERALDVVRDASEAGGAAHGAVKVTMPPRARGEGEDEGEEGDGEGARRVVAFGFDLDARAWRFNARVQAVRALGSIARATCAIGNDEEESFRDAYESFAGECAASGASARAPRGASWRLHILRGWRFDLRAMYDEVASRGGYGAIETNQGWRDVAERLGAHGRGCAAGHAVKVLYREWLLDFERVKRARDVAKNAAKFHACAHELDREDKDVIEALIGLELGASGAPPQRPKLENGLEEIAHQLAEVHESDANCAVCGAPGDEEAMILCDGCDRGSHMYCLKPKMTSVPSGEWFCQECQDVEDEVRRLSADDGHEYTLGEFNDACIEFDKAFFGEEAKRTGISIQAIEECFWRMVEEPTPADDVCEVKCGSCIDTTKHGSGFPRPGETPKVKIEGTSEEDVKRSLESLWNLNNIARANGEQVSMLAALKDDVVGVTTPCIEVGSTFSSTTWRREDHHLYSITYNHWGAAKTWYSVPASAAEQLENCFKNLMPDVFEDNPDALKRLFTMLSPQFLMDAGVPVYTLEQYPGEYVVTYPGAYYANFNCGLNCTESVNFAPPDWLAFGFQSVERNRLHASPSLFSHDQLLCDSAEEPSAITAPFLWPEITRLVLNETSARDELFASGVTRSARTAADEEKNDSSKPRKVRTKDEACAYGECVVCRHILYLSGVCCSCDPSRKACLRHAAELCDCKLSNRSMFYRKTLADLEKLAEKTESAVPSKELSGIKAQNTALTPPAQNKNRLKRSQAWVKRVSDELVKPPLPPLDELKKLALGAEEFIWGGSDMQGARDAHSRVMNAIAWQTSLATLKQRLASGSGAESSHDDAGEPRIGLLRLRELLDEPPVPMPKSETQPFREILATGLKLEERIKNALDESPNPAPRACSSLQSEANRFSVEVPSYKKLKDVISRAGAWSTKVRQALPGRRQLPPRDELASAHEIEELFKQATGLPVQQNELITLRKSLEELNFWRAKAESLFVNKVDIDDAEALLKEGLGLSSRLDEVDQLEDQITLVKAWAKRARESDYPNARVQDLQLLLQQGEGFRVTVEEVDWLKNRIVVRELVAKLRDMISSKKHTLAELETLVKDGNDFLDSDDKEVAPDEEVLLTQCETHIKAAKKWNEKAESMRKSLGGKDQATLDDAFSLIREGNTIPIILDGFDVLSEAVTAARLWLDRAQPCLKGKQLTRRGVSNPIPPLSEAQALLEESKNLKLFVKEVEALEERVEAAEEWDVDAKDAIKRWREDGAEVTLHELELSHEDFGLELPAMQMVRVRVKSLDWEQKVKKIIAPKAKLVEDTELDELRAEIDNLEDLDPALRDEIIKRHKIVDDWRKKADLLLDPPLLEDGRLAPSASPEEIDALIAEGKALPADVSKVEDLEASLADHAVWVASVRKCLNSVADGRPRPSIDELFELLAEVEDLTFKCSERQVLTNACNAAKAWTEKLTALLWINERNESETNDKTMIEMLSAVLDSIKAGIEDITGNGEPPDTEEGQFCLCRQAGGVQMVGCDDCGDWFHLKCINVSPTMAKTMHNYICPPCVAKNGKASALSLETYRSVHRTSRPNVMLLRELLSEAQQFPGEVPEENILHQLINTHDAWRLEVRKALHRKSMKEAQDNAITQAAKIAQEAARRETEERTRRIHEAALMATPDDPNPPATLTPLQQVMLMGQAVTFAATQRTHALSISPCAPEISEIVNRQLNQLQQLAMQLAMCQAQIHMAPVRSRPHILHVLMMQQQHLNMTKEHDEELVNAGASDWLMKATLQLSGIIPPDAAISEGSKTQKSDGKQSAGNSSVVKNEDAQQQFAMQPPPLAIPPQMGDLSTMQRHDMGMGIPIDMGLNDDIDPALQVYAGMKGALAMELEPVEETLALMREVCGPAWREQATRIMTVAPFPKLITLHELKESAMAAGLCPGAGIDPLADRAHALEVAGQIWLERAAAVVQDKTIPIEAAQMLLQEGRSLPLQLKEELEELGERCELYCVCRSAYDALRAMICCDRCDGWFHYECIGMQPPAPGEEDADTENVKFACPDCCTAQGIPYVPFRPSPKTTEEAVEAVPQPVAAPPSPTNATQDETPATENAKRKRKEPAHAAASKGSSRSRRRK